MRVTPTPQENTGDRGRSWGRQPGSPSTLKPTGAEKPSKVELQTHKDFRC